MKEPVKKTGLGISRKSELRIRAVLVSAGIAAVLLAVLFGTGTVSAVSPVSGPYSVQTYATGNQVTVTINLNNMSYENVYAQAEIIANGIPIVKQNFTGSTQLSAYVTTDYSVSILDHQTHSYVFDHVYKAPSSTADSLLNYEKLGAAIGASFAALLVGIWYGQKSRESSSSTGIQSYNDSDLDGKTRAAQEVKDALLDLNPAQVTTLRAQYPDIWKNVETFAVNLSQAVMHSLNVDPEEFVRVVKSKEFLGKMRVELDKSKDEKPEAVKDDKKEN